MTKTKTKGLGRGLGSLIPDDLLDEEFDLTAEEDKNASELRELRITDVEPDKEQPRREFDEEALKALAGSIKEHGVLQRIVVTRVGEKYVIVAGERRWRAAKMAGLEKIPAIIRTLDSQNRLELSVIENAQREDLNAIELATAYAKLQSQFNLTIAEIAARVGKAESSIVGTMRLLALPDDVKKLMVKEKLTEGVMRPLVSAEESVMREALPKIVSEGWSARQVERFIASKKKKSSAVAVKKDKFRKQEDALSEKYGVVARITGRALTFRCKSNAELEALIAKLGE